MKQKINKRLIGISILAVIIATVCITLVYYNLFERQVRNDLKVNAEVLAETGCFDDVSVASNSEPSSSKLGLLASNLNLKSEELRITWIAADGTVLYDNDKDASTLANHAGRPEVKAALKNGTGESVRKSDTMKMNTFYYALKLGNGTVLRVATEARTILSMFMTAIPIVVGIIAVIILICVMLSRVLTRQLIEPIESLALNIEDGTTEPPYEELIPFVGTIRRQHADILSAARSRQDFSANVSHELKTPLTAISGYAELIENGMVDETQQKHCAEEIRKNSERLVTLINDTIRLSELDRQGTTPEVKEVDLHEACEDVCALLAVTASKRSIALMVEGGPCIIRGNSQMIRELVENLVQNAIRYNNDGGYVRVTTTRRKDGALLIVEDNGIGIPAEEQHRIFERFYRVDKSRSKETGGTGLGLAIVKHIVELHGAELSLESEVGKGTKVEVRF